MKKVRKKKEMTSQERLTAKHPIIAEKIEKSLKRSVREGSFTASMTGFGTSYLSPFALALNATSSQIGVLNALASLLPSIIQLKSSRFIEKFSRKKIVILFVLLQSLMFLPIILSGAAFYFYPQYANIIVWFLIGFVALFYGFSGATHPAWFSWMGSLVPEERRGRYFSNRSRVAGFIGLVTMLIGALVLDKFRTMGFVLVGFGILFFLAFISRFIAGILFFHQYEPRLKIHKKSYFSLWQFLKNGRKTPFGRFTFFSAVFRISLNIAGPFYAVYMLRDLGFSYLTFTMVVVAGSIFQLIFYPAWGRFSDKYGNIRVLKIACISVSITPLLWIISSNPWYLMFVPQLVAGFATAGFYLAGNNYIFDSVGQEKRGLGVAYFNLLNGIGLFIGAGIGSVILLFEINFMNPLLFVFLIAGVGRLLIYALFARSLREVRHVKKFSKQYIIEEFNPAQGVMRSIHKVEHIGSKIQHYI